MDYMRILRRAFDITRFYPAMWVFGFLVALTAANGGGGGGGGGSGVGRDFSGRSNLPFYFPTPGFSNQWGNTLVGVGISLICVLVLLAIVFVILRYVSQNALIHMTDGYEATGEKVTVGAGFRLGWSNGALRLWLVDLLFALAFILALVVLGLVAAAPLLLRASGNEVLSVIGVVMTVILGITFILLLVVAAVAAMLVVEIARRAVVLEGRGVFDSIHRGWDMVRRRLKDVIIMGLIMFVMGLAFALLLAPVFIVLAIMGVLVGGLPGLLAGLITSLVAHGAAPVVVGFIVGLPLFFIIVIVPMALIGGMYQVFYSNVWTLTYRDLLALERVTPPAAPINPEPTGAEA